MTKNVTYVHFFIHNVDKWTMQQVSDAGRIALSDGDNMHIHFDNLRDMGNFAEKVMDLYNDSKTTFPINDDANAN